MAINYEDLMPFFNEIVNDKEIQEAVNKMLKDESIFQDIMKRGEASIEKEMALGNFHKAHMERKGLKTIQIIHDNKK